MTMLDETHDPRRASWLDAANGHADFPIQNLPLGIFAPEGGSPRGGVAIGDHVVDLAGLAEDGLVDGPALAAARAAAAPTLNEVLDLGPGPRRSLRRAVSALLARGSAAEAAMRRHLYRQADCRIDLPAHIGDYTDFYAGIHHAMNVGRLLRPDQPLMPNYKYVPIGYHGRASSVRPSGLAVRRPLGQTRPPSAEAPSYGPSRRLDFELELGVWIGPGNALGQPIPIGEAGQHIAGLCLLNDWSARDVQAWEYQPLGPFLAKNFATTVSPWIVTQEALAPFRIAQPPRADCDPAPLDHLLDAEDQRSGAFDISLEVWLSSARMRAEGVAPHRLARSNACHLYWTVAQMVAHHASGGCNLCPGDLLGTGTISGPDPDGCGSLLEATQGGKQAILLPTGEERRFLEDGDEVTLTACASRDGFVPIGFGACRGTVSPALSPG